jgi:hypothetical protein
MIKTFKGILADGGQERIRLQTIKGNVGYKIVKFQLLPYSPGVNMDSVVKINRVDNKGVAPVSLVDFTQTNLLAVGWFYNGTYENDEIVIFDREIFNQDIYLEHHEDIGSYSINYYLELEVIPLTDQGAEYTTIKNLRYNTATVPA